MPIRSPGDAPVTTVRDLGLPGRAVTALTRAGITGVDDLASLTRRELAAIPGLGAGMIAAIRVVVPEPGTGNEEPQAAPAIPSFDSLRSPRRRTALDLLMPPAAPAPSPSGPGAAPRPVSAAPRPVSAAPRPAEYADLLRFAVRAVRAAAAVPVGLVRWSVREPGRCVRRLLDG